MTHKVKPYKRKLPRHIGLDKFDVSFLIFLFRPDNSFELNVHILAKQVLSPVAIPLEVEVEMQDPTLKCAFETLLVRILPLFVDDAKSLLKFK